MSVAGFVKGVMKALLCGVIGVMGISAGYTVLFHRDRRGLFVIGVGILGEGQGKCTDKIGWYLGFSVCDV